MKKLEVNIGDECVKTMSSTCQIKFIVTDVNSFQISGKSEKGVLYTFSRFDPTINKIYGNENEYIKEGENFAKTHKIGGYDFRHPPRRVQVYTSSSNNRARKYRLSNLNKRVTVYNQDTRSGETYLLVQPSIKKFGVLTGDPNQRVKEEVVEITNFNPKQDNKLSVSSAFGNELLYKKVGDTYCYTSADSKKHSGLVVNIE